MSSHGPVICVVGPTATGKSEIAQRIAEQVGGEVLSADSMQVYRGMDIGTAKVPERLRRVPHFGLDLVDPGEPYSVALYQDYARSVFEDIFSRDKTPVLVGGSGFYVRAAIDDYDFPKGEQEGNPMREKWIAFLQEHDAMALWEELAKADPRSAAAIHPNNSKRVIRALEMLSEGISYADQLEALSSIGQHVDAVMIGLSCSRELLNERIGTRVDEMRASGLEDEVQRLLDAGFRSGITSQHAIGYKEIVDAFDGGRSIDQAYEDIKQATRRYAKRQRTWFGRDGRIEWVDAEDPHRASDHALRIVQDALSNDAS